MLTLVSTVFKTSFNYSVKNLDLNSTENILLTMAKMLLAFSFFTNLLITEQYDIKKRLIH